MPPISLKSPSERLTEDERREFVALEGVVAKGMQSAFDVGAALRKIRDDRYYRETYPTFEEYLAQVWDISRSYTHQLIDAADAFDAVKATGVALPQNEFQVRPLAQLPSDKAKQKAWKMAVQAADDMKEKVTHKLVKGVVDDLLAASRKKAASPLKINVDAAPGTDDYILGKPEEVIATLPGSSIDLVLINSLGGKTPAAAATELKGLLGSAWNVMKPDSQALVMTDFYDTRLLLDAAESLGFEVGVPFRWLTGSERSPLDWSATCEERTILHLRHGSAGLRVKIGNVIDCADETSRYHPDQRPLALVTELIDVVTSPGDRVLDLRAGAATANIACRQLGRHCVGIEADPKVFEAGKKRLAELGGPEISGVAA